MFFVKYDDNSLADCSKIKTLHGTKWTIKMET